MGEFFKAYSFPMGDRCLLAAMATYGTLNALVVLMTTDMGRALEFFICTGPLFLFFGVVALHLLFVPFTWQAIALFAIALVLAILMNFGIAWMFMAVAG